MCKKAVNFERVTLHYVNVSGKAPKKMYDSSHGRVVESHVLDNFIYHGDD